MDEETWRSSRRKRMEAGLIARAGYALMAAIGATLRWRVEGLEHFDAVAQAGHQPIMAFWHGRILPATVYFRGRGIVVITSRNFDGEWIARIIERFGYRTARGSTTRGGARALRELTRALASGAPVGVTLDGPRGPARQAQAGALWLAGATGHPVLPFHLEASRAWTAKSWDRTQVPRPFSTVALVVGAPIYVAARPDAEMIETARVALETSLGALEVRAHQLLQLSAGQPSTRGDPRG